MPKSKSGGKTVLPRRLLEGLEEAQAFIEVQHQPERGLAILLALEKAYPNRPEILSGMVNAYYDLGDMYSYEHAIRRLTKLTPRDPDLLFGLAGAHIHNMRLAMAISVYEDFLRRWPAEPRANQVKRAIALAWEAIDEAISSSGLPREMAFDQQEQHEEVRYHLDHGQFEQGRLAAEKLLKRYPGYVPAMNNLALIYTSLGRNDRAIELSRQVLEQDPSNLHARANLARLLFLTGHPDEALAEAGRLKDASTEATGRLTKLAETFSIMGNDQAVLELARQASSSSANETPSDESFFYHLLGVAALRQGKEKDARRYWQKALKLDPSLQRASQNLAELERPPAERNGPWAFFFNEWLLGRAMRELTALLQKRKSAKVSQSVQNDVSRFFERYPEIIFLVPHMLDRGDETTRDFVFSLAVLSNQPEIIEPVKEFVLGRKGSLSLRTRGARILREAGHLAPGPVKLWQGNEQTEILLLDFHITTEPLKSTLSETAMSLAIEAYNASENGDYQRAQSLLEEAISIQPDEPSLHYNLAASIGQQGDDRRANAMVKEIRRRFPDYFFAITSEAQAAIREKDYQRAHDLLNDLLYQRKEMHVSEFLALAYAQMDVWLAEKNKDAARPWLKLIEQVAPDHFGLPPYRLIIGKEK